MLLRKLRSTALDQRTLCMNLMTFMYILQCADGSYYVGSTRNLEKRLWQHNQGLGSKYTARRLPVKLVYHEEFASIAEAFEREKQVQNWSRAKREALIRGEYDALPELARKDFNGDSD
jgi:putative endonuclease